MKLQEIFDVKSSGITQWHTSVNGIRYAAVNMTVGSTDSAIPIVITLCDINKFNNITELHNKRVAEAAFRRLDVEGDAAYKTTGDVNNNPVDIYSTIFNAVYEQFIQHYDAIYFSANRLHSNSTDEYELKTKIYHTIAKKFSKHHNVFYYSSNSELGINSFLISKYEINHPGYMRQL